MDTINGSDAEGTTTAADQARSDAEWAARIGEADRQWRVQREREAEMLPLNKAALFEALAAGGISVVVVTFDGSGDSGQVEAVTARGPGGAPLELPGRLIEYREARFDAAEPAVTMATVTDVMENLSYAFLGATHDGWEINDGAFGEFTFDVARQAITLEYNERYTMTEFHEHEF